MTWFWLVVMHNMLTRLLNILQSNLHNTTKRREVRSITNAYQAGKVADWAGHLEARPPPPLAALPHPLVGDPLHAQAAGARAVQGAGVAGPGPGQQQGRVGCSAGGECSLLTCPDCTRRLLTPPWGAPPHPCWGRQCSLPPGPISRTSVWQF